MKTAIWVIVIILILVILYLVWKNRQTKQAAKEATNTIPGTPVVFDPKTAPCPSDMKKIGDGSACARISDPKTMCALWGNTGMQLCYDNLGNPRILKTAGINTSPTPSI